MLNVAASSGCCKSAEPGLQLWIRALVDRPSGTSMQDSFDLKKSNSESVIKTPIDVNMGKSDTLIYLITIVWHEIDR